MTYFLVELLKKNAEPITLKEAHSYLSQRVTRYVEENFPGTTQSPLLINDLDGLFYLRP